MRITCVIMSLLYGSLLVVSIGHLFTQLSQKYIIFRLKEFHATVPIDTYLIIPFKSFYSEETVVNGKTHNL